MKKDHDSDLKQVFLNVQMKNVHKIITEYT